MDYLTDAAKVLAIVAALIAFRLAVQAVTRRPGSGSFLRRILRFALPPLITGGPGLIGVTAFACAVRDPSLPWYLALMALLGGVGLAFGLAAMYGMLMQQQRGINRLEELIAGKDGEETLEA